MDSGTGTARRSTAHQDLSTYHWLRCESERDLETEKFEWFNGFCGVADRRVSACLAYRTRSVLIRSLLRVASSPRAG